MGVSASIYFRVREGSDLDVNRIPLDDYYCRPVVADEDDAPAGATHKLANSWRHYDEDHERGPWPYMAAGFMILLATPDIERVWYGPDSVSPLDDSHIITPGRVADLCIRFMWHGSAWWPPVTNNTPDQAGA